LSSHGGVFSKGARGHCAARPPALWSRRNAARAALTAVRRKPLAQRDALADTAFIDNTKTLVDTATEHLMNTTTAAATRLTQTVMLAALLAAAFMAQAADVSKAGATQIVTMPKVMVIGQRNAGAPAIVQMPQVTVIGRRSGEAAPVMARKDEAASKARPA